MKVYTNSTHEENFQEFLDSAARPMKNILEFRDKHITVLENGEWHVSDEMGILDDKPMNVMDDLLGLTIFGED
ncbi:MAG: hypothetical protein Unbinned4388contig1000_63 [Prokaryotic dsDNA virus sp.]|nr:MAG: hypothetical protein Unbinned4388contig1000_63 [Prokaryotic dsDNA virus sp.]|tara:strand:- start:60 stop:278 length:219 start_codon:yes stop_codon:yes gene_type:complete